MEDKQLAQLHTYMRHKVKHTHIEVQDTTSLHRRYFICFLGLLLVKELEIISEAMLYTASLPCSSVK